MTPRRDERDATRSRIASLDIDDAPPAPPPEPARRAEPLVKIELSVARGPKVGPTCHGPTELVAGDVVYPHRRDLRALRFWRCPRCGAFVGCHPGTTTPLGTPALPRTRRARGAAHEALDGLWRGPRAIMSRPAAYAWASQKLGIDPLHVGELGEEDCERLVDLCSTLRSKGWWRR